MLGPLTLLVATLMTLPAPLADSPTSSQEARLNSGLPDQPEASFDDFVRLELQRAEDLIHLTLFDPPSETDPLYEELDSNLQEALHWRVETEQALEEWQNAPESEQPMRRQDVRSALFALQESLDGLETTLAQTDFYDLTDGLAGPNP